MGDAPYEEYVPTSEELYLLKKEDPQVYETYWEVLCHFHICGQISSWRNRGVKQKTAYEMLRSLVGSEMCIRDRGYITRSGPYSMASRKVPTIFMAVSYTHLTLPTIYSV